MLQSRVLQTEAISRQSTLMTASSMYSTHAGLVLTLVRFVVVNNMTKITQEVKIPVERLE